MRQRPRKTAVVVVLLAAAAVARGNGRFPASTSVAFQPGDARRIIVGTTFGVVLSPDDGATWSWICEAAVGYGGGFDPALAATAAGTLLAGVYGGLAVSRDGGCIWQLAGPPLADLWISDVAIAADGAVWLTSTADGRANDVFVSRDDAMSFTAAGLDEPFARWQRVAPAPTNPRKIYVFGYRLAPDAGDGAEWLLRGSDDGGAHFAPLQVFPGNVAFLGVSPSDANVVFIQATTPVEELLRSSDGGASFAGVLSAGGALQGFAALADGKTIVVGGVSQHAGTWLSGDGGLTWARPAQTPQMGCAGARSDDTLFSCGANFAPDHFALGRSRDGQSWSRAFAFADMSGPLACPDGTRQKDVCAPMFAALADQFANAVNDSGMPGAPDAASLPGANGGGKCGCGISLALLVVVLPRPRRKRAATAPR